MTYEEAQRHFGSNKAIADALGVSKGRVSQCKAAGGFSYPMQCVLEKASSGKLSADRKDDPSAGRTAA